MASSGRRGAGPSPADSQECGRGVADTTPAARQDGEGESAKVGKRASRKKFDKNSPSSVTFKLVSTSFADPAVQQASVPKMALQRVIPPNALRKNRYRESIPENLLRVMSPEDFGIHSNLDVDSRRQLCEQIYGTAEPPPGQATEARAPATCREKLPVRDESVTNDELDGDCYFPRDGYDYSQHLVSIGGGVFLEHKETTAEKHRRAQRSKDGPASVSKEEQQVLEALENADAYEEILDDFVTAALETDGRAGGAEFDGDLLLWGEDHAKNAQLYAVKEKLAEVRRRMEGEDGDLTEADELEEERDNVAVVVRGGGSLGQSLEEEFDRVLEEYEDDFIGELEAEAAQGNEEDDITSEVEDALDDFLETQARRRKICIGSASSKHRLSHSGDKRDYLDDLAEGGASTDDSHSPGDGRCSSSSREREEEGDARDKEVEELFRPLGNWTLEAPLAGCVLGRSPVSVPEKEEVARIKALAALQQEEEQDAEARGTADFDLLDQAEVEKRLEERRWDCETVLTTKSVSSFAPTRISLPPPHMLKQQLRQLRETAASAAVVQRGKTSRQQGGREGTGSSDGAGESTKGSLLKGDDSGVLDSVPEEEEGYQSDELEESCADPCIITLRPRGETAGERRERKKAVKEAQRMVRQIKKQNKLLLKEEEKKEASRNAQTSAYDIKAGVRCVRL
ncbi:ribosomal protein l13 [Cystoisospora suis]|uniref:Ribosomal protein l13 n=1 Tax=Cystoisospora suis TaxID=483139 RepID=A0A2C6L0S3_9APIC|nr:ribosomal protein l13 [Cystoisospora suis]